MAMKWQEPDASGLKRLTYTAPDGATTIIGYVGQWPIADDNCGRYVADVAGGQMAFFDVEDEAMAFVEAIIALEAS